MTAQKDAASVLVVSSGRKAGQLFAEILPQGRFQPPLSVPSAGEARRLLVDRSFDIIAVNTPLPDEFGVQFALEAAENRSCGVLLFVKAEMQDAVSLKVEDAGVLTLPKPVNRQMVFQSVKLLLAAQQKIRALEEQTYTLQMKMEEIRLVNRAKLLLMEHLKMGEAEAHRYIEKRAMDACVKRREIAASIIKTYEN